MNENLDWTKIAQVAGKHGVRYPTNANLDAFMNDITQLSTLYSNAIARAEKAEEERDALIAAGLKCCDGIPNPNLRPFDLALSFIDSTNTARKAADMLWQEYKAELDAIKSPPPPVRETP